jgi:nucleoside-diphosphate-sugar epimerase
MYWSSLQGNTLGVFEPALVRRDFIRVDHVVRYIINLLETNVFESSTEFIDVNVSSGKSLYLNDAIEIIEAVLGRKLLVDISMMEDGVILDSIISNKKLRNLTSISLSSPESDIRDYFLWLKNQ